MNKKSSGVTMHSSQEKIYAEVGGKHREEGNGQVTMEHDGTPKEGEGTLMQRKGIDH